MGVGRTWSPYVPAELKPDDCWEMKMREEKDEGICFQVFGAALRAVIPSEDPVSRNVHISILSPVSPVVTGALQHLKPLCVHTE